MKLSIFSSTQIEVESIWHRELVNLLPILATKDEEQIVRLDVLQEIYSLPDKKLGKGMKYRGILGT